MDPNNFQPFLIVVCDYHRFRIVENTLKIFNKKIKLVELSTEEYDLASYTAIVYIGTKPPKKEIVAMLTKNAIHYVD